MNEPKYDRVCTRCGTPIYQGVLCANCHTEISIGSAPSAATGEGPSYPNARDCEHGHQRGYCPHCEVAELESALAASQKRCAELEKWHVSNWTCVHHTDKEREDNKPCCPVCARRELVELRQRIAELEKMLKEWMETSTRFGAKP